jgi:hypothetical protein
VTRDTTTTTTITTTTLAYPSIPLRTRDADARLKSSSQNSFFPTHLTQSQHNTAPIYLIPYFAIRRRSPIPLQVPSDAAAEPPIDGPLAFLAIHWAPLP